MAVDDAGNWRASIATFQEGYAGITFLAGLMRDPQLATRFKSDIIWAYGRVKLKRQFVRIAESAI